MKILSWVATHILAVIAAVKLAVNTVEGAATESAAKRQTAVTELVKALIGLGMPTGADRIAGWILGGLIDLEVGIMNALHGHNWYGTDANQAPNVSGYPADQQAHQAINQTNTGS